MATRKKTSKKAARKAPARKTTTRKPRSKVAVSDGVDLDPSGKLGAAAAAFMASCGSSKAVVTKKKRGRVERDLPPGTVLKRQFKGREIEVTVTDAGFVYEDVVFRSISAVARRITGYGISGPVFFRLDEPEASDKDGA